MNSRRRPSGSSGVFARASRISPALCSLLEKALTGRWVIRQPSDVRWPEISFLESAQPSMHV
jgi:hypothetical protein